jgi:ribose transport system permease protein
MLSAYTATGDPNGGNPYLLPVFAAIAIGGAPLSGSSGGVVGSMIGAATLSLLQKVLFSLNILFYYTSIAQGLLMILAVLASASFERAAHGRARVRAVTQLRPDETTEASWSSFITVAGRRKAGSGRLAELWFDGENSTILVLFLLSILLILASQWISPDFASWNQAKTILILSSFVVLVGFGQQMVILVGGIDLAIASVMTLGGILTFSWVGASSDAILWGAPLVLIATAAVGLLNGIGVTVLRIPPFIMTLAMGMIVHGTVLGITNGTPRGQASATLLALFTANWFGLPPVIYLMIAWVALGLILQLRTPFGRWVYAIGASPSAAYIAGLPVRLATILCYTISGAAAGLAGILMAGYSGGATLTLGDSYLFPSIAAAVIGGTSILGGRGNFLGVVCGAVLLTTLSTIITALGIAQGWRIAVEGTMIMLALLMLSDRFYVWIERLYLKLDFAPLDPVKAASEKKGERLQAVTIATRRRLPQLRGAGGRRRGSGGAG